MVGVHFEELVINYCFDLCVCVLFFISWKLFIFSTALCACFNCVEF